MNINVDSNLNAAQGKAVANKKNTSKTPTLIVVMMTSFISTFTGSALNLSVPAISSEFHAGAVSIGWIVTGYILVSATLAVPFGRFADIHGKKPVLVAGEIIFTVFALLCSFSWNIQSIIAFRLLQGVGAAMIFSTNIAILTAAYPPEKRGKMLGLSVSATYLGLSIGPVIGGFLNHYAGWRSIFYVTVIWTIITVILAVFKIHEPKDDFKRENNTMNLPGCVLYILSLSFIMYGFSSITSGIIAKVILPLGILLLVIFIRHELKADSPVVNIRMFTGNMMFSFSNLAALLNYGASYALSYLLSIYLQSVVGYTSQIAGIILITSPVFQTLLSPIAGHLSDKIAPYKLASAGMALTAVGIFIFTFIHDDFPLILIIVSLSIIGIGFALFSSPNTNAVMGCVEKKDYSVASSILATSRSVGHTASMAVVTTVVAVTIGNVTLASADAESIISAMRISFRVFTILCIAGIFFSAKRK